MFQTSIAFQPGLGVVGELYTDGPHRAQTFVINSEDATNNVFGRAFSIEHSGPNQDIYAAAGNSATNPFAGILVNPKTKASRGVGNDPLATSLTLNNYEIGEFLTMGTIIVTLPASALVGDLVIYNNTTGVLSTVSPNVPVPAGSSPAYAKVDYFAVEAAGLAVITLTPSIVYATA